MSELPNINKDYKYGFVTEIENDILKKGLNVDVIRMISEKKQEPEWLLQWRLKAYERWLTMDEPNWAHLNIPQIDYQAISYYAAPKASSKGQAKVT
jgi:Fe-S cluster assembly protein SufB